MDRTIRFQRRAKQDLAAIHRYTSREWGQPQAERYLNGLHQVFQRLATFPKLGTIWRPGSPVRILVHGSHRIV